MFKKFLDKFGLILVLLTFFILAFKNPFSSQSLIPNLEPYPDTFYYSVPAWNLVNGEGFTLKYKEFDIQNITPPLYSYFLVPFLAVFKDIRAFYFLNFFLGISSVYIFYLTSRKIFSKDTGIYLAVFLSILYASNFYVYSIPTFLIAENLSLFLTTLGIYLLISETTISKNILAGLLGAGLWLVKYSNFPLGAVFYFLYFLKVFRTKKLKSYIVAAAASTVSFIFYFLTSRGSANYYSNLERTGLEINNFGKNITFYVNALMGGETRFLWFSERMILPILGILTLLGLTYGLINKKTRWLAFQMGALVLSLTFFLAFFYATDSRYLLAILPAALILAGIFLHGIFLKERSLLVALLLILTFSFIIPGQWYSQDSFGVNKLGRRVVSNLRGSENAWYYVGINEVNNVLSNPPKKTYVGSFLPPFLFEFYGNKKYEYLPLSIEQDFFSEKGGLSKVMGINTINEYYEKLLTSGANVYVTNSFVTNKKEWVADYENMKKTYNFELVKEGCLGACNIYKLSLK